jgi:TolB-like protein/DNA-binding SARP family transcriptional activator/Flp pilus assembly protein TadD
VGNVKTAQDRQLRSAEGAVGLRIRLLGPVTIAIDGRPVAVTSKKARALVGYLALREGTAVARSVLTGLLWGERSEGQARASLRQTLSELRGALGKSASSSIVTGKETITWAAGSAWIDAKVLETAAGSGDEDALRGAAELLGGELMEGLSISEAGFEQWLTTERERFRLLACNIRGRLMAEAEQGGRLEEALAHGLQLLSLDPLQERVHRELMRLYAAQGRHDAALVQYEKCSRELSSQLGVRPEPETESLARSIRTSRRDGPAKPQGAPSLAPKPDQDKWPVLDRPSIAVLPFTNLSSDPEQQYFSDGITEDIITELSRYRSLFIIARNSSFQFRSTSVDVETVRRALGVQYVVEGSVRKANSRIRVTAQLINAVTQTNIWAERYDREIQDIFAVQDEVARSVASTLEGRIAANDADHARRKPPKDWAAYDYFLQGRECLYRYQAAEADSFFARAIELDPVYVHAHAWRAIALNIKYLLDERPETLETACACAQKALDLDDNDGWAHHAMGYVATRRREFDLAGQHFDRAIELIPNDTSTAPPRANWLMHIGRLEEALTILDAALQRDPYPPAGMWDVRGYVLYHLKRYEEAIVAFRNVRGQHFWTLGMLAAAYAQAGQLQDARDQLKHFLEARPGATLGSITDKIIYADQRLRDHWLDGLRRAGLPE